MEAREWFNGRMKNVSLLVLTAVLLGSQGGLLAIPITYTFAGFASGEAGGTPFADSAFTIAVEADTNQVGNPSPRLPHIFDTGAAPTSIEIPGIGSGTFSSGLSVYVNQQIRELGLTEPGANDLFAVRDPLFITYDLRSPLGPFFEAEPEDFVTFVGLQSTLGPITLADVHDITFTASSSAAAIPEPGTACLTILGAAALLFFGHKRAFSQ